MFENFQTKHESGKGGSRREDDESHDDVFIRDGSKGVILCSTGQLLVRFKLENLFRKMLSCPVM